MWKFLTSRETIRSAAVHARLGIQIDAAKVVGRIDTLLNDCSGPLFDPTPRGAPRLEIRQIRDAVKRP